jgi:DNA-binding beta-propeller fold protein YncE
VGFAAACGGSPPSAGNGPEGVAADGGPAGNDAAGDGGVGSYLSSLPAWPAPKPDFNGPTPGGDAGSGSTNYLTGTDGKNYKCNSTPYSLTTTPQQIVTFNPNVDVLWPGALLQGGPLQKGALVGLPITQRAPLAVSIPTLLSASNAVTVESPTVATVQQAVGKLINDAVMANVQPSSSVSYTSTEVHSANQAALALGVSADYLGFSLDATFNMNSSADLHTVMGYFVQNMFTVTVPQPEQPGDFFSGLTPEELDQQVKEGNIGPDNLPVYVSSVTYGRILMFSITSTESTQEIEATLDAAYKGAGSASGSASYSTLTSNSSTTIKIVTVGGDAADAEKMIQSGNPGDFFSTNPAISSAVPISYTLRNLGNNSIASVSESTSYSVQSCLETASGPGANIYVLNGDSTLSAFDFAGNSVTLTGLSGGFPYPKGLAYDQKNDQIYVALDTFNAGLFNWPAGVWIIGPDGSPIQQPSGAWSELPALNSITYDPLLDRMYIVSPQGVQSYTTAGKSIEGYADSNAFGSTFDPHNQWLYVTNNAKNTVDVFALNGTPVDPCTLATGGVGSPPSGACVPPAPAFPGLASPDQIVYDSHHDLIYVSQLGANNVLSFHPNGTPAGTFVVNNANTGIAYDDVNDHLIVVDGNDGLLEFFNPDGSRVTEPPGAFSGLSHPFRVIVRP